MWKKLIESKFGLIAIVLVFLAMAIPISYFENNWRKKAYAAQNATENCERYRDKALKVLEQVETTGEGVSNRNLMIAIQYLGRAQKAAIEYQSCLAQQQLKRYIPGS